MKRTLTASVGRLLALMLVVALAALMTVGPPLLALSVPGVAAQDEPEDTAPPAVDLPTVAVTIVNFAFDPVELHIPPGTTVVWTNQDTVPHTATGEAFDSGNLNQGDSFSFTFNEEGAYPYICNIHQFMQGIVVVESAG